MISDLLLDINVVVDICARRHPYFVDVVKALDKAIINPTLSTWIRI
jgi:ribosomal protein L31